MKINKILLFALGTTAIISCASVAKPSTIDTGKEIAKVESQWENLKVLPQDILEEELKGLMREFNTSLGVKCNHCHAPNAEGKMDFASDAKKEKGFARHMMTMTQELNKNHFDYDEADKKKVSCFTCHQGSVKPKKITDLNVTEVPKLNSAPAK